MPFHPFPFVKYRTHLFLGAYFVCGVVSNGHAQYPALYHPEVPDNIEISLSGKQLASYQHMVEQAYTSSSIVIDNDYKKPFSIRIKDPHSSHFFKARARIMGDWKDHISSKKNPRISSLKISMKKGNMGGIVTFKLFLPHTRNKDMEVFWTSLVEELGYPSLFTKNVIVSLNGVKYKAIFQECPAKELLERYGFREAPIVEADERQSWANLVHEQKRGDPYKNTPTHAGKIDNNAFLKNRTSYFIGMKAIQRVVEEIDHPEGDNITFFDEIHTKYAKHAMQWHNRKFIYDPIYNFFIPLYYDGNVTETYPRSNCSSSKDVLAKISQAVTTEPEKRWLAHFFAKYEARAGKSISNVQHCIVRDVLATKQSMSQWKKQQTLQVRRKKFAPTKLQDNYDIGVFEQRLPVQIFSNQTFQDCMFALKYQTMGTCSPISDELIKKSLAGKRLPRLTSQQQPIFNFVQGVVEDVPKTKEIFISVPDKASDMRIDVARYQLVFLDVIPSQQPRKLTVYMQGGLDSKVVISGHIGKQDQLYFYGAQPMLTLDPTPARYDKNLLTSCVTFYDATFAGGTIEAQNMVSEDAINILRSNGEIGKIRINNAAYDALDIDFSTVSIADIQIRQAGNDCIDLSSGKYRFASVDVKQCGDKGVSVGEKAFVNIGNAKVTSALDGLVAKDSSNFIVQTFKGHRIEQHCLSAYQKKQEFGPADLRVNDYQCKGKVYTDQQSRVQVE